MAGLLEPSFLLELGAYAVAIAGIRLVRNRLGSSSSEAEIQRESQAQQVPFGSFTACAD